MKIRTLWFTCALPCIVAETPARAQDSLRLNELRTPTSPAFVILGVEPTSIERPTTPRAFALGLLSAPGGAGGVIPENYAAELAPYWMRSHPDLTFQEYTRPGPLQAFLQTLSISVATTVLATGADSTTGIGVGLRATPVMGHPPRQLRLLSDSLRTVQRTRLNLSDELDEATSRADSQRIQRQIDTEDQKSRGLSARIRALPEDERVGLHVQFAGALAGYYPRNDFSAGRIGRTGLWGTVTYRAEAPRIDVIGLARWLRYDDEAEQNAVDLGVRGLVRFNRLSASAEFVNRSADALADGTDPDAGGFGDGNRVVALLEYRASDDLFVTFSFGQDFASANDDREPLVAVLGGQLHFGPKPLVALP